jgi:hypothetical protein
LRTAGATHIVQDRRFLSENEQSRPVKATLKNCSIYVAGIWGRYSRPGRRKIDKLSLRETLAISSKERGWVVGFYGIDQIGMIIPYIAHIRLP